MNQNEDGNQNKDNKLFALMDIINSENENNVKEKLNIPDYSMHSNSKDIPETLDEEEESRQSLNPDHKELLDITDSGIIQIPNNYGQGQTQSISNENNNLNTIENEFSSPLNSNKNTLDESIKTTLLRDIRLIYYKLKHVINPFSSNINRQRHIREWDLWGPLLFITLLSCTLAFKSENKSNIVVIVFAIFWLGSLLVYLNATLVDSKIKLFPVICLLGYCLFPLNISAFILSITNFYEIIRFLLVLFTCVWALVSVEGYFRSVSSPEQKWLVFYPAILMFAFIAWFVFTTK